MTRDLPARAADDAPISLRERQRIALRADIQQAALRMFAARGFDNRRHLRGHLAYGGRPRTHGSLFQDLVGELSTRSDEFRRRCGAHDVRTHGAGAKTFHHDVVGDLELFYESVDMISDPGQTLTLYVAEPASPTEQALELLASWTAEQLRESLAGR